jgi:hypothetical protein
MAGVQRVCHPTCQTIGKRSGRTGTFGPALSISVMTQEVMLGYIHHIAPTFLLIRDIVMLIEDVVMFLLVLQ